MRQHGANTVDGRPAWLIISPAFPPLRGGVADHTRRLAQELSQGALVGVLTSVGADQVEDYPVHPEISNWRDIEQLLSAAETLAPTANIIWQYVPHLYGRGGVNLRLPRVMHFFGQHHCDQLVIAHEIAAPYSAWPHRCWYAWAQRRQWRQLLEYTNTVGISTEAWLKEWMLREPRFRDKMLLLPSPSSLPLVPLGQDHAQSWRARQGLPATARVLTFFGTLSAAKQFPWLVDAWRAAQVADSPVALVVIGAQPHPALPPELKPLFKPLGYLAPEQVSAALHATDVLALPFVDGVSERRTSFMSGLQHGCAVVTTSGHNTGPTLRKARYSVLVPANDRAAFRRAVADLLRDQPRRLHLRAAAREAYRCEYDWPRLTARINLSLGLQAGSSA